RCHRVRLVREQLFDDLERELHFVGPVAAQQPGRHDVEQWSRRPVHGAVVAGELETVRRRVGRQGTLRFGHRPHRCPLHVLAARLLHLNPRQRHVENTPSSMYLYAWFPAASRNPSTVTGYAMTSLSEYVMSPTVVICESGATTRIFASPSFTSYT